MGLDMYLTAERYLSPYQHNTKSLPLRKAVAAAIGYTESEADTTAGKICGVNIRVAYWRKANQIHAWFVNNVQKGEDDCKKYYVDREQLDELLELCKQVLKKRDDSDGKEFAEEHLPISEGCFFDKGDPYDECYYEDLGDTINMLSDLDKYADCDFEYQASW